MTEGTRVYPPLWWAMRHCINLHRPLMGRPYPHTISPGPRGRSCICQCVGGRNCTHLHYPPTRSSYPHPGHPQSMEHGCFCCVWGRGGGVHSRTMPRRAIHNPTGSAFNQGDLGASAALWGVRDYTHIHNSAKGASLSPHNPSRIPAWPFLLGESSPRLSCGP